MSTKAKAKSSILDAVHETALDLQNLGFIDKRKMRKFDLLWPLHGCDEPLSVLQEAREIGSHSDYHSHTPLRMARRFGLLLNRLQRVLDERITQQGHCRRSAPMG